MDNELFDMYSKKSIKKENKINIQKDTGVKIQYDKKTNKVLFGEQVVEIVNPKYVNDLEEKIQTLSRQMKQMQYKINSLVVTVNRQAVEIQALKQEANNRYRFD